jgi:hypothetical protein
MRASILSGSGSAHGATAVSAAAVVRVVAPAGVPTPALESWLTVSGTFRAMGADGVPELVADSMTPVPVPVDPYE